MTRPDFAPMRRKMLADIERTGRSVIGVFGGDNGEPPFCYTIGNHLRGLPELLLIGGCTEPFSNMLNELSEMAIRNERAFADGERVMFEGGSYPVLVVAASDAAKDELAIQATNFHGSTDYPLQQIVLCDPQGRFPGEPGCADPFSRVTIMRRAQA